MPLIQGDQRKECCKDSLNLKYTKIDESRAVRVCQVCGCRHFEFNVDPFPLGIKGFEV